MLKKIVEKHQFLKKELVGNPQGVKLVNAVSKLQWIETSYALDGGNLTSEEIKEILDGRNLMDRTIRDHVMIRNYNKVVNNLYSAVGICDRVDHNLIKKVSMIFLADEVEAEPAEEFRKTVPIVSELDMIPMHPQEIQAEMEKMLQAYHSMHDKLDPVMRGCYVHNELLRIYPFAENNGAVARAMLNFELLVAGYPPIPFTMDKRQYYDDVVSHIRDEDPEPFYLAVSKVLSQRLNQLIDLI